ncbi:NucA/NucB deoxyribonuclease domain-containing protein [Cupriavidus gilardii]|uniref:NucA/NucB deoxyribonuclease domain-containing protein n=1 Tax=Cupriavidus gilardii TaxID=82541 RepID=UPI0009EEC9FD|nr:hypothetical protein [Cupriavidus gilardii]
MRSRSQWFAFDSRAATLAAVTLVALIAGCGGDGAPDAKATLSTQEPMLRPAAVVQVDVPAITQDKCQNDADYIFMSEDTSSDNQQLALVNRHVDCRSGLSDQFDLYVELKEKDGVYSYANPQVDGTGDVIGDSIGTVRFRTKMSVYGPYNRLSKRVAVSVKAEGFNPNPEYKGPVKQPLIKVMPIFACGESQEVSGYTPECTVAGSPLSVPLNGGEVSSEYTITFNWVQTAELKRDALTFPVKFDTFAFAPDGASFQSAYGQTISFYPRLDSSGILLRCDRGVAYSGDNGCVFPQAAAVLTVSSPGAEEYAAHIMEAQTAGAPGKFQMKPGFRAIADDSVRGTGLVLQRTQIPIMNVANRYASCGSPSSLIVQNPRASSSCSPTGGVPTCQCDEYPFASTYQGAFEMPSTTSAKYILAAHNGKGGTDLGTFYRQERVIDLSYETGQAGSRLDPYPAFVREYGGDAFWVHVTP